MKLSECIGMIDIFFPVDSVVHIVNNRGMLSCVTSRIENIRDTDMYKAYKNVDILNFVYGRDISPNYILCIRI